MYLFSERFYGLLDPDCQVKVSWWPLSSIKHGWAFSFILPALLSIEKTWTTEEVLLKLVCFVCFTASHLRLLVSYWMRVCPRWPSDPAAPALFTHPQALLVLRQLHYLQDHPQKPGAAGCSLICNPESEPAGFETEEARPVISGFCFVALQCIPWPRSHPRKNQPLGKTAEGL